MLDSERWYWLAVIYAKKWICGGRRAVNCDLGFDFFVLRCAWHRRLFRVNPEKYFTLFVWSASSGQELYTLYRSSAALATASGWVRRSWVTKHKIIINRQEDCYCLWRSIRIQIGMVHVQTVYITWRYSGVKCLNGRAISSWWYLFILRPRMIVKYVVFLETRFQLTSVFFCREGSCFLSISLVPVLALYCGILSRGLGRRWCPPAGSTVERLTFW